MVKAAPRIELPLKGLGGEKESGAGGRLSRQTKISAIPTRNVDKVAFPRRKELLTD